MPIKVEILYCCLATNLTIGKRNLHDFYGGYMIFYRAYIISYEG